ncbi:collagen-like protein [Streptomyces sp. NPDC048445]|uniref:collagen-like protein n=1 Tax=Streptomyces sp. NPDC048445 TaxID=3365553 RepID=UPI003719D332
MTRAEHLFYRRRFLLWIVAALLFLGGAVAVAFLQIDKAQSRGDQLAAEADRRGTAVTTLATDVRRLRAQVQARGGTPAAPDPGDAVEDLPARAEVPVPIPGPPGPRGEKGARGGRGATGASAAPSPGPSGASGRAGTDSSIPGPVGPVGPAGPAGPAGEQGPAGQPGAAGKDGAAGANGKDGTNGRDGTDGQTCPGGYSLQPPPDDPDALVCRRDTPTAPDPGTAPTILGLPADRRRT